MPDIGSYWYGAGASVAAIKQFVSFQASINCFIGYSIRKSPDPGSVKTTFTSLGLFGFTSTPATIKAWLPP